VEVEELEPIYLQMMLDLQNKLGDNIRDHLDLVKVLIGESQKRADDYDSWRTAHSPGPGGSVLRKFWTVMTTPL
jgi:hypothetical protein